MASPIFVSNQSPAFSLTAIAKGCQFAFLGAYRLLQNQLFFETAKYFKFTWVAVQLSILVQLFLSLPFIYIKVIYWILKFTFHKIINIEYLNEGIAIFLSDILQLQPFILLVIHTLYCDVFEDIFNSGLQYIDQVTIASKKQPKLIYSTELLKLKRVDLRKRTFLANILSKLNGLSTFQINHLSNLSRAYMSLISSNLFLFSCARLPYIGSPAVSFIVSRSFNSKLGTSSTFLLFIIGLILPTDACWKFYSLYHTSQFTVKHILNIPYFQKLHFTDQQAEDWLDSRSGLSFGFGLVFHLFGWKFNYIGLLILIVQQLSISYFISQVTDPVPETIDEPWLLTQIYWTKIYNKLTVSSDGFKPIPLSYIIFKRGTSSPDTSAFVTPIASSTNLNKLE